MLGGRADPHCAVYARIRGRRAVGFLVFFGIADTAGLEYLERAPSLAGQRPSGLQEAYAKTCLSFSFRA